MKFSFAPLVLIAALFTTAFSAPTERALSKRLLNFTFNLINIANTAISIKRDVEGEVFSKRNEEYNLVVTSLPPVNDLSKRSTALSKRLLDFTFNFLNIANTGIAIRRDTEGEELFGRSTDEYEGRHVVASIPDSMVEALRQMGVSQNEIPGYISKTVLATDPATGEQYQLIPDTEYTPSANDIVLDMFYQPIA